MKISLLKILSLSFILALSSVQAFEVEQRRLNKEIKNNLGANYKLLKSIGFNILVSKGIQKEELQYTGGNPLLYRGKRLNYPLSKRVCKTLCLSVKKNSSLTNYSSLITKIKAELPKIISDKSAADAYRLKISLVTDSTIEQISSSFEWPEDDVDALGTGFSRNFKRTLPSVKELRERGMIENGSIRRQSDLMTDEYKDINSFLSSWTSKGKSSKAVESLLTRPHTSGCQIALGSAVHGVLYNSYASTGDQKIFDKAFPKIVINNGYFKTSKLLPRLDYDYSGMEKMKNGVNGIAGEAGYLQAVFEEKVENPDYAGENIIFSRKSSNAAIKRAYKAGGFGSDYIQGFDESRKEDSDIISLADYFDSGITGDEEDIRLDSFEGLSKELINIWKLLKKLQVASKLSSTEIYEFISFATQPVSLSKRAFNKFKKKNSRLLKSINRKVTSSVLSNIYVFGHPGGEHSLADWSVELFSYNPNTPYYLFIYDYGLKTTQWESYKKAFLKK